jgi:hypothetical protein
MQFPLSSFFSPIILLMTPLAPAMMAARPSLSLLTLPISGATVSLTLSISSKRVFTRRIFFQPAS